MLHLLFTVTLTDSVEFEISLVAVQRRSVVFWLAMFSSNLIDGPLETLPVVMSVHS